MNKDFGIRLALEMVSLAFQFFLQRTVIFNDAVVNDRQCAGRRVVGMCVHIIWLAVGGPAGVADADVAVQILITQVFFQLRNLALFL